MIESHIATRAPLEWLYQRERHMSFNVAATANLVQAPAIDIKSVSWPVARSKP
jgi:hypothetical protein